MHIDTMDDNISDELNCDAGSISNVYIHTTPINGLEAVHDELFLQSDHHVALKHNPKGFILDYSVSDSSRFGVHRIIITWVSYNIEPPIAASNSISPKPNRAISEALSVALPVLITSPAIIYWVPCAAREVAQFSPRCAVLDTAAVGSYCQCKDGCIRIIRKLG